MILITIALKFCWFVDQRCRLESVHMTISSFCACRGKVHVFAVAYIDGAGGSAAEFVEVAVGKVGSEFYFVDMVVS